MKPSRSLAVLALIALTSLPGCASKSGTSSSPSTSATSASALEANADTLVTQLQAEAPAVSAATGASPATTADITAGLWAAKTILTAMQGLPVTASDLQTGIPAVDNVLQANLGSGNATAQDVKTIGSVINTLAAASAPASSMLHRRYERMLWARLTPEEQREQILIAETLNDVATILDAMSAK